MASRFKAAVSCVNHILKGFINNKGDMGFLYIYRYISLLLTSGFYVFIYQEYSILYKLAVVMSLFVSGIIIQRIYKKMYNNMQTVSWAVVLLEMIGISALLIPTGGTDSPFIWYALNPVLVSACFLHPLFCWGNLFFFCSSTVIFSAVIYNDIGENHSVVSPFPQIILVLALITFAIQLLARLLRKSKENTEIIQERNKQLETLTAQLAESNKMTNDAMHYIMSLYECLGALTSQSDKKTMMREFLDYACKLSRAKFAFFYPLGEDEIGFILSGDISKLRIQDIENQLYNLSKDTIKHGGSQVIHHDGYSSAVVGIKHTYDDYGMIGTAFDATISADRMALCVQQLQFLAQLCSVILRRFEREEFAGNMKILAEQKRIANEIHDNVCQRLFSIGCAMHSLHVRWSDLDKNEINKQIKLVEECALSANRELRSCIYKLRQDSDGYRFFEQIRRYLNHLARLNDLKIKVSLNGDEEKLSGRMKHAIERIIRESVSNSIRHGQCNKIELTLNVTHIAVDIQVSDNGIGIDFSNSEKGLGLNNMKDIAQELNGQISICSAKGAGVQIQVTLPLSNAEKFEPRGKQINERRYCG